MVWVKSAEPCHFIIALSGASAIFTRESFRSSTPRTYKMFNQDVDFMLFLSGKHEEKAKMRLGDAPDSFAELSDTQGTDQD
jgi:hypothetical protein